MAEEEVGRGGRGASSRGSQARGMGIGAKVGLAAGAATLVLVALAVLPGRGGDEGNSDADWNQAGFMAVTALASSDAAWWAGSTESSGNTKMMERIRDALKKLFGEQGPRWFDDERDKIVKQDLDAMDADERKEALEARKKYEAAEEEIEKGAAKKVDKVALTQQFKIVAENKAFVDGTRFEVLGAWIRESAASGDGDIVVGTLEKSDISYDLAKRKDIGGGLGWVDGTVKGQTARVFTRTMQGSTPKKKYVAYVAIASTGGGPTGGNMIGLLMLVLAPLVVGGIAFAVAGSHAKSVKDLGRELERLGSSGDPTRAVRAHGAEAMAVARAVERMVANLEFRQKHGSADLGEVVDKERKVAEEIHGALMSKNPPRITDYEVETLFKPGFEIAGDHFEYFRIDEHHLGVILLDTNVRGIPAALVMASARSYVRAAAPGELSPAAVLRQVNRHLAGDLPPGRHVTALYAVIDTVQGKATVASAGHLPLLVYRHATGKVAKVNPEGIALGLDVGPVFDRALQEGDIPIGVGDRIVLYTDGALKIQSETGEEFGEPRFYGAVAREAPKNSQAFVNFVGSAIDQFHLTTPQNDDITISTVKRLR